MMSAKQLGTVNLFTCCLCRHQAEVCASFPFPGSRVQVLALKPFDDTFCSTAQVVGQQFKASVQALALKPFDDQSLAGVLVLCGVLPMLNIFDKDTVHWQVVLQVTIFIVLHEIRATIF
jgi:hypothetical protein